MFLLHYRISGEMATIRQSVRIATKGLKSEETFLWNHLDFYIQTVDDVIGKEFCFKMYIEVVYTNVIVFCKINN